MIFAQLEQAHNVGMVEPGESLSFAAEALNEGSLCGELRPQDFEGDVGIEPQIVSAVDGSVATLAQSANDLIATRDGPPRHEFCGHAGRILSPAHVRVTLSSSHQLPASSR